MSPDREPRTEAVQLVQTQKQVALDLYSAIQAGSLAQSLYVVEGFSGVGKSTVIDWLEQNYSPLHLKRIRGWLPDEWDRVRNSGVRAVAAATPSELDSLRRRDRLNDREEQVLTVRLPGMNYQEIMDCITRMPRQKGNTLSPMTISRYSLGIPLLAQRLSMPGITKELAPSLTARYLLSQFKHEAYSNALVEESREYLQMPIPPDVEHLVERLRREEGEEQLYSRLEGVLDRQQELTHRGISEESPIFLAPESEAMYNEMLRKRDLPNLDIFVPNIDQTLFERIQQSFGFQYGEYQENAQRFRMFLASFRKVSVWRKDSFGEEKFQINEKQRFREQVELYRSGYLRRELGLVPGDPGMERSMHIHAHDHFAMMENPALVGWLTESMLQNLEVPYHVTNHTLETSYVYNPRTQRIDTQPQMFDYRKKA